MKCLKCQKKFTTYLKIDGKVYNLCSRSYCIDCSPLGLHNTKKLHDENVKNNKLCLYCNRPLCGNQYKFCSDRCSWLFPYKNMKIDQLIKAKGSKCIQCEEIYFLGLYHRDPKERKFCLNQVKNIENNSWEDVLIELEKCDLLCMNCLMIRCFEVQKQKIINRK